VGLQWLRAELDSKAPSLRAAGNLNPFRKSDENVVLNSGRTHRFSGSLSESFSVFPGAES
jgi:hypothetical protein